jgi:hypothetical protein
MTYDDWKLRSDRDERPYDEPEDESEEEPMVDEWTPAEVIAVATIIQEAENQGPEGMLAIAEVIRERTERRIFSRGTIPSTCFWPLHFSGWNAVGGNRTRSVEMLEQSDEQDSRIVDAASSAWRQATRDRTTTVKGATHYYNPKGIPDLGHRDAQGVVCPDWAEGEVPVAIVRDHRFYRLVA